MEQREVEETTGRVKCIGDTLHIFNPAFVRAVTERDRAALLLVAREQLEGGADGLAVNLGPAAAMRQHLAWLLETLEGLTGELFLWADALQEPSLLRDCRSHLTINAVTAEGDGLDRAMAAALAVGADLVVLLLRPGMAGTAEEQLLLAAEVLAAAQRQGFPVERLLLDPLLACRSDPHSRRLGRGLPDLQRVIDLLEALPLFGAKRPRSIVGLGNITAPSAGERSRRQGLTGALLAGAGLDALLCDCRDRCLLEQLRGAVLATAA